MKKYDVVYGENYTDRNGEEQVRWKNVGANAEPGDSFRMFISSCAVYLPPEREALRSSGAWKPESQASV